MVGHGQPLIKETEKQEKKLILKKKKKTLPQTYHMVVKTKELETG